MEYETPTPLRTGSATVDPTRTSITILSTTPAVIHSYSKLNTWFTLINSTGFRSISGQSSNGAKRTIIKEPQLTDRHYIERLLALECVPEYGGPPLLFTNWHDKPLWNDCNLLATRWACAGCLRLLPYYHFQYKFLAEVIWRKPMLGTPATKTITSWEPTNTPTGGVATTPPADGGGSIQARYNLIVGDILATPPFVLLGQYRAHGLAYFNGITEFGSNRHYRKCNGCLFKNGVFNDATITSHNGIYGTESFPIISIENHMISSPLDRYFPGILDTMQQGRPFKRFYQGFRKPWTLWMARCPRCDKWQELRAFRIGAGAGEVAGGRPGLEAWEPTMGRLTWDGVILTQEVFEKAYCNACFVAENGRHALAEYLGRWFVFLVEQQPHDVQSELLHEAGKFPRNSGALIDGNKVTAWNWQILDIHFLRCSGQSPWHLSSCFQSLYKDWLDICGENDYAFLDNPNIGSHMQYV
ncbi:hypothetical protein FOWG_10262 [Fusarium oxysporum f. sp. lycopersici MN25]|nr:hypothetical protein FOWG_10262 [Fusarium oxysporum f. sp. lycopersici MN25]